MDPFPHFKNKTEQKSIQGKGTLGRGKGFNRKYLENINMCVKYMEWDGKYSYSFHFHFLIK